MNEQSSRLAVLKRAKPIIRDSVLMTKAPKIHPLVEKTARAISDWHSEVDWQLHEDKAIRSLEVVAEHLRREGYRDASDFVHSTVWKEPSNRRRLDAAS